MMPAVCARRARWLLVGALAVVSLAPGSAYAGGDEPSEGGRPNEPPGPWSTDRGSPVRSALRRHAAVPGRRDRWRRRRILGVFVSGRAVPPCDALGRGLPAVPARAASGGASASAGAASSPRSSVAAGAPSASTTARSAAYRCVERRKYGSAPPTTPTWRARASGRRIDHSYTLLHLRARSRSAPSGSCGRRGRIRGMRHIAVTRDIVLHACVTGDPMRESSGPVVVDGRGHTLRQGCFEKRLLRQDGTGYVELRNITLTRGGSDGPGGAVTTRGEITVIDSKVQQNLAEEPGGGIMSQRRATIIRSIITGNLANDDGGGVYARRGGIQVYDSILSANLVDGSGGALGSTGDILVVRSHLDGNTTDGDGGAIYADEDGDVTVIDSTVSGSDADGPGGAIFTLDGDVTIINSTLTGNRADDRGGAVSGRGGGDRPQLDDLAQPGRRARRRRPVVARADVRRQLDDQQQLRRGQGRRPARRQRAHARQLDGRRQHRVRRREHRRRRAPRRVRLGDRPGEDSTATAATRSRPTRTATRRSAGRSGSTSSPTRRAGSPGRAISSAWRRSLGPLRENGGSHETQMPDGVSPALGLGPGRQLPGRAPADRFTRASSTCAAQVPDLRVADAHRSARRAARAWTGAATPGPWRCRDDATAPSARRRCWPLPRSRCRPARAPTTRTPRGRTPTRTGCSSRRSGTSCGSSRTRSS